MKYVIITDLDGTLLDLHTYSPIGALPAVEKLKFADIPIVFCSAKTKSEQMHYLKLLGLNTPFICESGSAVYIPENYFSLNFPGKNGNYKKQNGWEVFILGKKYKEITSTLEQLNCELNTNYHYFGNQSVKEISKYTDLPMPAALRASERGYSETIFNADPGEEVFNKFVEKLSVYNLKCEKGTKFVTVTGKESDKEKATSFLVNMFKAEDPEVKVIGIGDSEDDIAMLKRVDLPFLVQYTKGKWIPCELENVKRIDGVGPEGWTVIANMILEQTQG